jgi:hypothetical protein
VYCDPEEPVEEDDDDAEIANHPKFKALLDFVDTPRRIDKVEACLCEKKMSGDRLKCINGQCDKCGFKQLWSEGLRRCIALVKRDAASGTNSKK